MIWLAAVLALALAGAVVYALDQRAQRLRATRDAELAHAAERTARAVAIASAEREAEATAAKAVADTELRIPVVRWLNGPRGGAGAVLLALSLLAVPARAECVADGDAIRCDVATLESIRAESVGCARDLRIARADVTLRTRQVDALTDQLIEIVAMPAAESRLRWWHVGIAGGVVFVVGVAAGVLLAR